MRPLARTSPGTASARRPRRARATANATGTYRMRYPASSPGSTNVPIARPWPIVYKPDGVFASTMTIAASDASAPDSRYAPKTSVVTPRSRTKRRIAACQITPPARIAMNTAPASGSKPSTAATSAAAGKAATGRSVGIGSRGIAGSRTIQYAAMSATNANSATASGGGSSDTPGTGACVSVMNAGNSGIRKNERPSEPARTRCKTCPLAAPRAGDPALPEDSRTRVLTLTDQPHPSRGQWCFAVSRAPWRHATASEPLRRVPSRCER